MTGKSREIDDSLDLACSFLIGVCRTNHRAFYQQGFSERALLRAGPDGLDAVIESAVGLGLMVREGSGRQSVYLHPGPRWFEIERALFDGLKARATKSALC